MTTTIEKRTSRAAVEDREERMSFRSMRDALGALEGFDGADGSPENFGGARGFPKGRRREILASAEKTARGVEDGEAGADDALEILRLCAPELFARPLGAEVLAGGPPVPMSGVVEAMRQSLDEGGPTSSAFVWWLALAAADAAVQGLKERKFRGHLVRCIGEAGLRSIGFRELRDALRDSAMWPKEWRR